MHKMYEFRKSQVAKMESDPDLEESDISSVDLTAVNSGETLSTFVATFDVRLAPNVDSKAFEKQVCHKTYSSASKIRIIN